MELRGRVRGDLSRRGSALLLIVAAALVLSGCAGASGAHDAAPASSGTLVPTDSVTDSDWLGFHNDDARTGAVPAGSLATQLSTRWSAKLAGGLHNQAVAADDRIIVADESNHVTALSPRSGTVVWRLSLGKPLTQVDKYAGCGNLDPLGITSTPVIDPATHIVYVVGEVRTGTRTVHHQLEGINILTGAVVLSENIDPPLPPSESAIHLLQRASLALANGRVYVSFGGNSGDCGRYHGWLVSVNESGSADKVSFEVASDGEGGAIWQGGGAPAIDSAGNVYVTTGNANPDPPHGGPDPKAYTESVVKLSPDLVPLASFKDEIAGGDEDLSTTNPVLLPNGNVFSIGKTRVGYVLRQSDLSEVTEIPHICGSNPDGGPAYDAARDEIFVPCTGGGIQQVYLGTAGSTTAPSGDAPVVGARLAAPNSSPILVGDNLWALSYINNSLTEYDVATDQITETLPMHATIGHFVSPTVAYGLLLVGTSSGVVALGAAASPPVKHCDPNKAAQLGLGCVFITIR